MRNRRKLVWVLMIITFFNIFPIIFEIITFNIQYEEISNNFTGNNESNVLIRKRDNPKLSPSSSTYEWWNISWSFRVPINISANGAQQNDVPVEIGINFTEYFININLNFKKIFITFLTLSALVFYLLVVLHLSLYFQEDFLE